MLTVTKGMTVHGDDTHRLGPEKFTKLFCHISNELDVLLCSLQVFLQRISGRVSDPLRRSLMLGRCNTDIKLHFLFLIQQGDAGGFHVLLSCIPAHQFPSSWGELPHFG